MSGVKCSDFKLLQERKAREEALSQIESLNRQIMQIQNKAQDILRQLPEGVKAAFPNEVGKAHAWLRMETPSATTSGAGMTSGALQGVVSRMNAMEEQGREVHALLVEVKEVKRDAQARKLLAETEGHSARLEASAPLLSKWLPQRRAAMQEALGTLPARIEKGELNQAQSALAEIRANLRQTVEEAGGLETEDRERRSVLESLRNACMDMGWAEVGAPALQNPNDPAALIMYEVNTFAAGIMTFYLTLKNIRVDSPIPVGGDVCHKDFLTLSEKLLTLGVETEFERIEVPDEEPKLAQSGELDLPDEGVAREEHADTPW